MKLLRPECREKFTFQDFEFICSVLAHRKHKKKFLQKMLADPAARDKLLDAGLLFRAILEWNQALLISPYLYFYIIVRNIFLECGIMERILADYVAMLLVDSTEAYKRMDNSSPKRHPFPYMVDLLDSLQQASPRERPKLHADIGNHSLFLTGIFLEFILARETRKGSPGVAYYEEIGKENFRLVSRSPLAGELKLDNLFNDLATLFSDLRLALNQMTREYQHLHETSEWKKVEMLLRDIEAIG